MKTALVQVRVDEDTKRDADELFDDLGMDTATAIRVFLRQAIQRHGLPFEVRRQERYNAVTEAAIAEGDAIAEGRVDAPSFKSWDDFESSMAE